ncbi:MAG: sulfotransferase family 2 domain-containing protein, partial [Bacteroidia bacterium]
MTKKVQPLIFLHIPKTAGVTIHFIIKRQYFLKKIFSIFTISQTKNFTALSDEEKLKYKVVKGHMYFGVHEHMPVKSTYFTFLREPYARTLSGYHFVRRAKTHPNHKEVMDNNYSLKEFLERKLVKNFDNMQVRFLAGANDLPFGEVNEAVYQKAKENFDTYFKAFGLVERFDESILYLKEQFNWSNPYYVKENKSPV